MKDWNRNETIVANRYCFDDGVEPQMIDAHMIHTHMDMKLQHDGCYRSKAQTILIQRDCFNDQNGKTMSRKI